MLKRKPIAIFLPFLLFVFLNSNLSSEVYTSCGKALTITEVGIKNLVKTTSAPGFSFSKQPVKKHSIRTRYMGGECSCYAPASALNINAPEFIDEPMSIAHYFFIAGNSPFLFTLRGPPAAKAIIISV